MKSLILLSALLATSAHAASITKGYTFTSGSVASAAAINSNFDQLFIESNDQDARIAVLEAAGGSSKWTLSATMIYYNGGNVGIGTAAPTQLFHVSGGSALIDGTNSLYFANTGSAAISYSGGVFNLDATGGSPIDLKTSGTARMRINATGVGIGTTNPTTALSFPNGSTGIMLSNTAGNTETFNIRWVGNVAKIETGWNGGGASRSIQFGTANANFLVNGDTAGGLYQFSQGNGLASVDGTVFSGTWSANGAGANNVVSISPTITQTGTASYRALLVNPTETTLGSGASYLADFQVGGVSKMAITNAGQVGINDDTPSFMLDVNGTMRGFGITDSSDLRLKKEVRELGSSLEKILRMRAVRYRWKDETRDQDEQIGLIAQEVEKEFPEFVKSDNEGIKSVNYSHMVAPLLEAVKELAAKNKLLEEQNSAIKAYLCAKDAAAAICR